MAIFRQLNLLNKTTENAFYLHQVGTTKRVYVDHQWVQIAQIDAAANRFPSASGRCKHHKNAGGLLQKFRHTNIISRNWP